MQLNSVRQASIALVRPQLQFLAHCLDIVQVARPIILAHGDLSHALWGLMPLRFDSAPLTNASQLERVTTQTLLRRWRDRGPPTNVRQVIAAQLAPTQATKKHASRAITRMSEAKGSASPALLVRTVLARLLDPRLVLKGITASRSRQNLSSALLALSEPPLASQPRPAAAHALQGTIALKQDWSFPMGFVTLALIA